MPNWTELTLADGVRLKVPAGPSGGRRAQGVDSTVATWEGSGLNILIDRGPFADTLASSESRSGYRSSQETIDGRPARIVSFVDDGTRVVAAHVPRSPAGAQPGESLTVVIRLDSTVAHEDMAYEVIRSLKFGQQ